MKRKPSRKYLILSLALATGCTFNLVSANSAIAATISQATIELVERDLKDPNTSRRDFSKEVAELKATIEEKDSSPQLKATCYRLLSSISSDTNDMSQALEYIEKAFKLNPTDKDVLVQRAFAHILDPNREEVAEYFAAAIAVRPDLSWLYFNRGSVLQGLERHKEAIEDLEKAAELSSNDQKVMAYFLEVDSRLALSDFKGVVEVAKKVPIEKVKLPDSMKMTFLKDLGYSQLRENQFDQGIKTLGAALELATNDKQKGSIHYFRSLGYYKLNQKEKADEEVVLSEKYGYRPPNSPPPDRVAKFNNELAEAMKPYIEKARQTLPDAKKRYQAGLPAGHRMSVTTLLTDKNGHHEQVFVTVNSWNGDAVSGILANSVSLQGFKRGQALEVKEKDMLDWTIVNPKGEEEGNLVGKFIDTWLDEHNSEQ
ncbi:MAG: DUF2314 domain-containing protein [Cyanobacteria bacterium TGS_CYA1]|nr:DUF2314 domain-containing protein [Cyanobacteria bacterium TGS_CYA1]